MAKVALAIDQLVRAKRLRNDIAAYNRSPLTEDESAPAAVTPAWNDLADDTDWATTYQHCRTQRGHPDG